MLTYASWQKSRAFLIADRQLHILNLQLGCYLCNWMVAMSETSYGSKPQEVSWELGAFNQIALSNISTVVSSSMWVMPLLLIRSTIAVEYSKKSVFRRHKQKHLATTIMHFHHSSVCHIKLSLQFDLDLS